MVNYRASIAADRAKQAQLENRVNNLENKLANYQSIYQNAASQYNYSSGGNIYDNIDAENYYVDSKKYGKEIRNTKDAIKQVNHEIVVNTGNLSQLNSELQLMEQREQQEQQRSEQNSNHWWGIFMAIISFLPMLFM